MADRAKSSAVRLSDVAKRAQCSAATVSRVLNAPESVNPEARLRVEKAVRDLGYMRNGAARALRSRKSQIVGIVIPSIGQPMYAEFVRVLQLTLSREHYSLIVTNSDFDLDKELLQARLLVERGIDGLVLVGHSHRPEVMTLLQAQGLPYVTTYTYKPRLGHPSIGFDNAAAMETVVDHLYGLGHRSFSLIAGSTTQSDRVYERVEGATRAIAARGARVAPGHRVAAASSVEAGRSALRRLLATDTRPTAVLCTSDTLAYGVLVEARAQGIAIPSEMSVTGFDDLEASAFAIPALTTVRVPSGEMGQLSADYLLARIEGRPHADPVAITAPLILRATTAPPQTMAGPRRDPSPGLAVVKPITTAGPVTVRPA